MQIVSEGEHFRDRTAEAIELPDAERVAGAQVVQRGEQSGSVLGSNSVLGVDPLTDDHRLVAEAVLRQHRQHTGGRLFQYLGGQDLTGHMTVENLLAGTEIKEVVMVGQRQHLDPEATIDTQGFVRPSMTDGRIQLVVRPAADGLVIPFEAQPHPLLRCAVTQEGAKRRCSSWSGMRTPGTSGPGQDRTPSVHSAHPGASKPQH